jgi:polyhydroxyalkanoate synthesis regulator phasin
MKKLILVLLIVFLSVCALSLANEVKVEKEDVKAIEEQLKDLYEKSREKALKKLKKFARTKTKREFDDFSLNYEKDYRLFKKDMRKYILEKIAKLMNDKENENYNKISELLKKKMNREDREEYILELIRKQERRIKRRISKIVKRFKSKISKIVKQFNKKYEKNKKTLKKKIDEGKRSVKKLEGRVHKLEKTPTGFTLKKGQRMQRFSDIAQIQAQSVCVALAPSGWTYAVRRECTHRAPSCDEVCSRIRARQAKKRMRCINALHIYSNTGFHKTHQKGLKTYKYNSCSGRYCGPNFCCCHVK